MNAAELKNEACASVDSMRSDLLAISHAIHAEPELSFQEHRAAAHLIAALRSAGLRVDAGAYGLETAFSAEFGADGPLVALLAEYDALPVIGHACGHNIIAAAGIGAGLALFGISRRLPGRIRMLGTPAEERGGGKELMARNGALEGVDAVLMIHPANVNLVTMPSLACAEVTVRYRGRASHAAAAPSDGVNALDALVVAYQAIGALRQHIGVDERIHGIVTDGGQAPNIVPETAAGRFYVRAANAGGLERLKARVEGCFRAGAEATGARLELEWGAVDYLDIRYNAPLAERFRQNAESLGREFTPLDRLPASMAGSTDLGNVSYRVPAIHPMLQAAPSDCNIHNSAFTEHAGAAIGDQAAIDGAKALAMTAIDFFLDTDLCHRTRAWFEQSAAE